MEAWPHLPLAEWRETRDTLHMCNMCTQVVGKVRLALTPTINHCWNVPLYLSARGLATSEIPYRDDGFDMELAFVEQLGEWDCKVLERAGAAR